MDIIHDIVVDLSRQTRQHTIEIKKNSINAVVARFILMNDGHPIDGSELQIVTVKGVKPDGSIIYADADIEKDEEGNYTNIARYEFSAAATSLTGRSTYEIAVMSTSAETVVSFDIYVDVINQLYNEDDLYDENDLSGVRSYLNRALNAATTAEGVQNTIIAEIGDAQALINEMGVELLEYEQYLSDLQEMVTAGRFNGARGPQGPAGRDGIITTTEGMVAFSIEEDGDLYVHANEQSVGEAFSIDEDGNLIFSVED